MFRPARILLAEDDTVDARAFTRALAKLRVDVPVTVARDGAEAWEMLKPPNGRAPFGYEGSMLVFDINLPRLSGLELLTRIRADEALRDAVVFLVTTSESELDRGLAGDLNVAGYILKSDLPSGLEKALGLMGDYYRARQPERAWVHWEFNPRP
jgi:CheY-like chemotaxis protein